MAEISPFNYLKALKMEMRTTTLLMVVFLTVCAGGGCSTTNQMTTQKDLGVQDQEPFMAELKEIATKRDHFYFLGQAIDEAEFERRRSDMDYRRVHGLFAKPENLEVIPIMLIRF